MKKVYLSYTILFLINFIIELVFFFGFSSNLFGLIYMLISVILFSFLCLTTENYSSNNRIKRISKNSIIIILMVFISFVLPKFNYIDPSHLFVNKMNIFINYINIFFIVSLVIISIVDFRYKDNLIVRIKELFGKLVKS